MFTVYSKPACPFCDQAKALLGQKGLPYQEVILDVGQMKEQDAAYIGREDLLKIVPNARTMPQILNGKEIVGGFTDLKKYLSDREALKTA